MLHGNEALPVEKENELALVWAEMTLIRWVCGIKVTGLASIKVRPDVHIGHRKSVTWEPAGTSANRRQPRRPSYLSSPLCWQCDTGVDRRSPSVGRGGGEQRMVGSECFR